MMMRKAEEIIDLTINDDMETEEPLETLIFEGDGEHGIYESHERTD